MINLMFKAALDATGFQRGLVSITDSAKKAGDVAGQEIGKDFKKSLKRTIGAGALAASVVNFGREAQDIRNMAAALGVTEQQYAAMEIVTKNLGDASSVSADEVKRLADELIAAGEVPDNEAIRSLAESADMVESAWNNTKAILTEVLAMLSLVVERMVRIGRVSMLAFTAPIAGAMTLMKGGSLKQAEGVMKEMMVETAKDVFAPSSLGKGRSIAERAVRTPKAEDYTDADADRQAAEKWDEFLKERKKREEMRKRAGDLRMPQSIGGLGELASMGLGNARGSFGIERQMLDEQKKAVQLLRDQKRILDKKL